jgi:hypothetical protein
LFQFNFLQIFVLTLSYPRTQSVESFSNAELFKNNG